MAGQDYSVMEKNAQDRLNNLPQPQRLLEKLFGISGPRISHSMLQISSNDSEELCRSFQIESDWFDGDNDNAVDGCSCSSQTGMAAISYFELQDKLVVLCNAMDNPYVISVSPDVFNRVFRPENEPNFDIREALIY
jgi:hypothetical protein